MRKKKSLNRLLAENLARVMAERELSANELGRMVGVSPRTIGKYLKQEPVFTPHGGKESSAKLFEVEAVARKLNLPPLALLIDPSEGPAPVSDDAAELAGLYDSLDPQQQKAVYALVQSMQRPKP